MCVCVCVVCVWCVCVCVCVLVCALYGRSHLNAHMWCVSAYMYVFTSSTEYAAWLGATGSLISAIFSANILRSSVAMMASTWVPSTFTSKRSNTPWRFNSTPQFRAICPPKARTMPSGRSFRITYGMGMRRACFAPIHLTYVHLYPVHETQMAEAPINGAKRVIKLGGTFPSCDTV